MYTEIVTFDSGVSRLRINIDPENIYFTDENFKSILSTCSMMIDRAAVKCLLGLIQKLKDKSNNVEDNLKVIEVRNMLNRYEAGLIEI
jgi:hypothetical protein